MFLYSYTYLSLIIRVRLSPSVLFECDYLSKGNHVTTRIKKYRNIVYNILQDEDTYTMIIIWGGNKKYYQIHIEQNIDLCYIFFQIFGRYREPVVYEIHLLSIQVTRDMQRQ